MHVDPAQVRKYVRESYRTTVRRADGGEETGSARVHAGGENGRIDVKQNGEVKQNGSDESSVPRYFYVILKYLPTIHSIIA